MDLNAIGLIGFFKRTALMQVCEIGQTEIVKSLLDYSQTHNINIDLNARDSFRLTAFVLAFQNANAFNDRHKNIVKLLLGHPCSRNQIDNNAMVRFGMTALKWAVENGHEDIVELLLQHLGIYEDL